MTNTAIPVASIPIIAVSYQSPDLIDALLRSIRQFYPNKVYIIDGSQPDIAQQVGEVTRRYPDVEFIPFGYNIHHGPGLAWSMHNLDLSGPVMFLDSDVEIVNPGFLEDLLGHLEPHMYGVGDITHPLLGGVPEEFLGVPYLSPACMLCNIDVMRHYPPPIKHGAPMVLPMVALARAGQSDLVKQVDWVKNDFGRDAPRIFIKHEWQGTVTRTKGYHYDTQLAGDFDAQLLSMVPPRADNVIEVGCGRGAFARAYKNVNTICNYTGVESDTAAVAMARTPCDFVYEMEIGAADDAFFAAQRDKDCWIFPDSLHKVGDPWALLAKIRGVIPDGGSLVLAVPNMQHWSVQARLSRGALEYDANSLLQRSTRRWFTRATLFDMLHKAGFRVESGAARNGDAGEAYHPAIRAMAQAAGADPDMAVQDCIPLHYLVRAVPVPR